MSTSTDHPGTDRGVTHPLNVSYLVVGLVFLGLAGAWALRTAGVVDTRELGWLLPLTLVGAGAVGLVGFAAKGLRRSRSQGIEAAGPEGPDDVDDTPVFAETYIDDLDRRLDETEGGSR